MKPLPRAHPVLSAVFIIVALTGVSVASVAAADSDRYQIINTTIVVSGTGIPMALLIDTASGASWYLALTNVTNQAEQVPVWESIPFFPDLTATPPNRSDP